MEVHSHHALRGCTCPHAICHTVYNTYSSFSRPYLSNGRAVVMVVVRPSVRAAVGMGIPMGMGMGTVPNFHGFSGNSVGIFEQM